MMAVILAAGRGRRMRGLTNDKPKCLTLIHGKALIEHQIDVLYNVGIKDIAIVTGYKSSMLKNYGCHNFHNPKWFETNIIASLLCAREWLDTTDCIISYSDIFYDVRTVKRLIACEDDIAISFDPNWLELWAKRFENPLEDAETFSINEKGYVLEIGNRPNTISEIQGQYIGLLKFKAGVFSKNFGIISDVNLNKDDMTSFLYKLILKQVPIKAIPVEGLWYEIDQPKDLDLVQ